MNCPHCLYPSVDDEHYGPLFELCRRCGTVLLDFGHFRPRLYLAVEAQVERWEHAAQAVQEANSA